MEDSEAHKSIHQMIQFIINQAEERSKELEIKGQAEYTSQLDSLQTSAFAKIKDEFANKLDQEKVKRQIDRSGKLNSLRLKKMSARNELIEEVIKQALDKLGEYFQNNPAQYKQLMRQLLLQGMIKLLETSVEIEVRRQDVDLIQSLIPEVCDQYAKILNQNVKSLEGKTIKAKIKISKKKFLPDKQPKGSTLPSCCGGMILKSNKGKIVCSNTIDERLLLCFQIAIPEVRTLLFPSDN